MKVMTEEGAKLEALRRRLGMISLVSTVFTCAIFAAVWLLFLPDLPLYVPALFVLISLLLWAIVVRPSIDNFARNKKAPGKKR
ncbi:MAG: hypothetical protein M1530_01880 [Candidatus Marsarchaeota archaeon]|nr:hypothetical protein [Candidatus Marsarchaeota archaeon]